MSVVPGKLEEVGAYAREVGPYVKSLAGVQMEFAAEIGGDSFRVGWFSTYPDLGAFQQANTKCFADPKFREMFQKVAHYVVPGSVQEKIWQIA